MERYAYNSAAHHVLSRTITYALPRKDELDAGTVLLPNELTRPTNRTTDRPTGWLVAEPDDQYRDTRQVRSRSIIYTLPATTMAPYGHGRTRRWHRTATRIIDNLLLCLQLPDRPLLLRLQRQFRTDLMLGRTMWLS